jgi:CBS domain-containing protein
VDRSDAAAPIERLIRRRFVAVGPDDTARAAEALMRMGRLRSVPVVDGVRFEGMLSYAPLVRTFLAGDDDAPGSLARALDETCVAALMDDKPARVRPQASRAEAAQELVRSGIGCVPVVDAEGCLVGIVTEADLLRRSFADADLPV